MVFCTYKSIHRIIVPFAAALRGGGIKGTRWESGAYPVAVFAAARLCAERRPLWAGAHEKAGSRAGRFWQVLCRARLHEPEDLVMRGRLRTQIGHGNNGRGRIQFCHGPFASCVRNRGALVRHAFPFEKHDRWLFSCGMGNIKSAFHRTGRQDFSDLQLCDEMGCYRHLAVKK